MSRPMTEARLAELEAYVARMRPVGSCKWPPGEIPVFRETYEAWRELLAEVRELRRLLGEWADLHDAACRFDHEGACQAHFVERDCIVDRTRGTLGRWRLVVK